MLGCDKASSTNIRHINSTKCAPRRTTLCNFCANFLFMIVMIHNDHVMIHDDHVTIHNDHVMIHNDHVMILMIT